MGRTEDIARGVARRLGAPGLVERLVSRASGAQLKSLLMAVTRARSLARTPADVMGQARRDATVAAGPDLRRLHAIDGLALAAAAGFEAVELSMLQPIGTSTALGGIDQNSVMATIAGTEVVPDPTSAMALEAARRRRGAQTVRLCTSQRVLRMQPFDNPSFTRHFRLFAALSAGRDRGAERFEMEALREHLGIYLTLLSSLAAAEFRTQRVSVRVADTRLTARLAEIAGLDLDAMLRSVRAHRPRSYRDAFADAGIDLPETIEEPEELDRLGAAHGLERELARLARVRRDVFAPLAERHPAVGFGFAPFRLEGGAYYVGYCFHVEVEHDELGPLPVGDGGFTRWTARLLGNRKERMIGSGIGTELLCKVFAPT